MISILSPSKTMNFDKTDLKKSSELRFKDEAWQAVKKLKRKSKSELKELMGISDNLTSLNYDRFKKFSEEYELNENAKQAILAYRGDVYTGFDADSLSEKELLASQKSVRILSGLYGLVRPLDLIQAYRLEMGIPLKLQRNDDLYEFWGDKITKLLNKDIEENNHEALLNLASNEYYDAINEDLIDVPIIKAKFRERRNGKVKFISFNAKKARGQMARFIVEENIQKIEHLEAFDYDGYVYNKERSEDDLYFFIKE